MFHSNNQIDQTNPNICYTTVTATPDGRLNIKDTAKYLGVDITTLAQMRENRYGPDYTIVGHTIFYYIASLNQFLDASWRGTNSIGNYDDTEDPRNVWLSEEFQSHLAHLPEQDDITDDEWLQHYCL